MKNEKMKMYFEDEEKGGASPSPMFELSRVCFEKKTDNEAVNELINNAAKILGQRGAYARHATTREDQEVVINCYKENESKYKEMSSEKVAEIIRQNLRGKVYLAHRTIASYIRKYRQIRHAGK